MVAMYVWYERVNNAWPEEKRSLVPSAEEAVKAAKKLWRWEFGTPCPYKIRVTSGNRYSWIRGGVFNVNPDRHGGGERGWSAMIHDLSHCFWRRKNEGAHSKRHAKYELAMRKEVLKRGWLDGALKEKEKPAPSSVDMRVVRYERVMASIARWEAKERRAHNALVKLRRSARGYERHLALPA